MSKLIGTNPNQVPSNADLGTAAFMDKKDFLLSKGSSLSAIDAVIPNTAVDVFIYDTSKDSDGGAWRKRTQHTSWYNEKLNTTTRGSRREFPAVAVIVVETAYVTIYDGDDPSLPMWMGFSEAAFASQLWENSPACVYALNAKIAVGNSPYDLNVVDFIADNAVSYSDSDIISGTHKFPISGRAPVTGSYSTPSDVWAFGTVGNIINRYVNDVAMTVLTNAPIDPATGLPIPTIAVATNNGVSVIKDDGNVWDITGYGARHIEFVGEYIVAHYITSSADSIYVNPIPSADANYSTNHISRFIDGAWSGSYQINSSFRPNGLSKLHDEDYYAIGDSVNGLIYRTTKHGANGGARGEFAPMAEQANITSSYNTGWMTGNIKLATLSDTDASDNSREYITNGTFDSNASGWSVTSGASITASGGVATVTSSGSSIWSGAYQGITGLEVGKTYIATADIITSSNWGSFSFSNGGGSAVKYGSYSSWNGGSTFPLKARAYFVATTTSVVLAIDSLNTNSATVTQIDNITVREAEVDRSVNAKPLQVFGTVKKTPVASGADLVAYSGFTSGVYNGVRLEQPYNSDLNPGSGDYSISCWVKDVGTGTDVMGLGKRGTDLAWNLYHDAGGGLRFTVSYNGTTYQSIVEIQFGGSIDQWSHVVYTKVGDVYSAYLNGNLYVSNTGTSDTLYTTSRPFMIGAGQTNNNIVGDPKYALLKISKTAPSPEQIKKMYEDEKALFQENAKATLYGTSDAITALAYDEDTNLLHAGTSAGRSVFQGLRRVDNTTRAVGTAISAVDGFVVEE